MDERITASWTIGLDLSDKTTEACVLDAAGEVVERLPASSAEAFAKRVRAVAAADLFAGLETLLGLYSRRWWQVFGLCAVAIVSHGLLDALTGGGLGIAFFLPFDLGRYFLPFHPLVVSPIGLSNFLAGPIYAVLGSEILFVWTPLLALITLIRLSSYLRGSAA